MSNFKSNLTDEDVSIIIQQGESYRCEFKSDLSSKDNKEKICRTICAFANDVANSKLIGLIILGLSDSGLPTDLNITDELELKIMNIRSEGKIVPLPSFICKKRTYLNKSILCIEIQPAVSTPIKYDGRIWVRPGNSTQLASAEDEYRIIEKRRSQDQSDDCYIIERSSISDLNLLYFKEKYLPQAFAEDILAANGRSIEAQLASTKMIASVNQTNPTVLGMLCLGQLPQNFIPGAYVQFLRLDGLHLTDYILDEETIKGTLEDIIKATESKFKAHNKIAVEITTSPKEIRKPDYPLIAFEQIFRNAVLHRKYLNTNSPIRVYWYEDRIEITNAGGLFGSVNENNFGEEGANDYRNPNLAQCLRDLNYIQRFGAGIGIAQKAMLDNKNKPIEFRIRQEFITAILYKRNK